MRDSVRTTSQRLGLLLVFVGALAAPAAPVFAADEPSATETTAQDAIDELVGIRQHLGLVGTRDIVARLKDSPEDVGSSRWGIPMTRIEEATVNLPDRARFANRVAANVLPLVEKRLDYAGAWIDGKTGGLVLALTGRNSAVESQVREVLGGETRPVTFDTSPTTAKALEDAADSAMIRWSALAPDIKLLAARARKGAAPAVLLDVPPANVPRASTVARELSRELGVTILAQAAESSIDTSCTTRDSCFDPFRAGILVRNASKTSGGTCTMGFHIWKGSPRDFQWLTAGHCGAAYTSTGWYHKGAPGDGKIGNEISGGSLFLSGVDVMRVQMADSQVSNQPFGSITWITGRRNPILGETLCAVLGANPTAQKCGQVVDDYLTWQSSTPPKPTVHGADLGITTVLGDSGSPIFTPQDSDFERLAVGISATSGAYFGRMGEIVSVMGIQVYEGW